MNLYASNYSQYFGYLEPKPNSSGINKESTILFKPTEVIVKNSISAENITVIGSQSGIHSGKIIISDDNLTYIYKPDNNFVAGEVVTVKFHNIKTSSGNFINPFQYSFSIRSDISPEDMKIYHDVLRESSTDMINAQSEPDVVQSLPQITLITSNNPTDGNIFMTNIGAITTPYLMILDNLGQPVFTKQMAGLCFDFKKQPNGNYTYYDQHALKFYELNKDYNVVDSFYCGNGYYTDLHELRLLDNGHALLMSYDSLRVDSSFGNGGEIGDNPRGLVMVIGLIIQEIDTYKNVIFQWRSWDHFKIIDATHENLISLSIDYVHGNSIEMDNDGNYIISCRHMDEITKINKATGNIMWRMGGRNNQFTFINDSTGFSHQHAVRRIKNGNITLFDNGNFRGHSLPYSRVAEYKVDEQNKTATLVWQYRNNPDIYSGSMGYAQRLDNGNTVIGWGGTNTTIGWSDPIPTVTEIKDDGTKVFELALPHLMFSYRSFRYQFGPEKTIPTEFKLSQNYPNPFNPVTTIHFNIPKTSHVKLSIYDILGREVSVLVNDELTAASYDKQWNAANFSSGIYFYKLVTDVFTESKKMILVK